MLTEIQKELVNQILSRKIIDFSSFLFEYKLTDLKSKEEIDSYLYNFQTGYETGKINLVNFDESFNIIIIFYSLLEILEQNKLIYTYKILYKSDLKFGSDEFLGGSTDLIIRLNSFFIKREMVGFLPLKELGEFAERDYLTEDEFYKKEEDKDRKTALRQSTISQRWTIGISVGIFVIGTIINIFI
jgi:hypothetical protein